MSGKLERFARDLAAKAERLEVPQAVVDVFGVYRDEPVGFCRTVLGVESATRRSDGEPYQFSVLDDLVAHPRVAVQKGHGVGGTALDAWATLWWLLTRPYSRVVVLAPEFSRQIRAVLFSEMRRWTKRATVALPLDVLANRVLVDGHGEEWSATGMSTAGDPARIEGFHAPGGVLVIADETKGIPQDAFDAVQGALTGADDARLLVTSVPGGAGAGPFWKACQDPVRWRVHHIPATDSSLVSPEWVADRAADWGVGSPLYQCRVLGAFADAGEGVLYPLTLLDAATERAPTDEMHPAALGVDVGRSVAGDLNAVARFAGGRLEVLKTWRSPDLMVTVERVLHIVAETGVRVIAVDVGGPGGGAADRLRQLGNEVRDVAFGGGADEPARFRNRRAELFWRLREALEKGTVALADDDELRADLSAIRYTFTAAGQIQIEAKDEVRARLGRSPDRADAVALAAWVAVGGGGGTNWSAIMEHFDRHLTPLHGVECRVCYAGGGAPRSAPAATVTSYPPGELAPTSQRCPRCTSVFNAGDFATMTACPQCGQPLEGAGPVAVPRLPALLSPTRGPEPDRPPLVSCPACGAPGGGRGTCARCGHVN